MIHAVDDAVAAGSDTPSDRGPLRVAAEQEWSEAQRDGADARRVAAAASVGTARWWAGDVGGAVTAWRSVVPLLRTVGDVDAELAVRLGLARALAAEGAWDEARAQLAAASERAHRSGAALHPIRVRLAESDLAERRGHLHRALDLAEGAWVGAPQRGGPAVVRLCLALGDPARAAPVARLTKDPLDAARIELQRDPDTASVPEVLAPWAAAVRGRWPEVTGTTSGVLAAFERLAAGDVDQALAAFDLARIARAADGWPVEAAVCGLWSAGAMADAGRGKAAAALLAELEVLVEDADAELVAPSFDLARARIARAMGDDGAATALAANARVRVPHPALHVLVDLRAFAAAAQESARNP